MKRLLNITFLVVLIFCQLAFSSQNILGSKLPSFEEIANIIKTKYNDCVHSSSLILKEKFEKANNLRKEYMDRFEDWLLEKKEDIEEYCQDYTINKVKENYT